MYKNLEKAFFKYGFLVYVYLLNELEQKERYEECAVILKVVQDKNKKWDMQLPTRFNDEAIAIFLKAFRESPNKGYIALQNVPHYANELKELIEV